jgi:ribosomal-protein-serine acetyltransferase
MFTLPINDTAILGVLQSSHAEQLFGLFEKNRARFEPWLPFMATTDSVDGVRTFIRSGLERFGSERGGLFGIWFRRSLVGCVSFRIHEDGYATLGYWLDGEYEGKGMATAACRALAVHLFDDLGVHRIEIRCEPDNLRSIAVAERAGFTREATLRGAINIGGAARDLIVFARLRGDSD